jgi:hypothetical protein
MNAVNPTRTTGFVIPTQIRALRTSLGTISRLKLARKIKEVPVISSCQFHPGHRLQAEAYGAKIFEVVPKGPRRRGTPDEDTLFPAFQDQHTRMRSKFAVLIELAGRGVFLVSEPVQGYIRRKCGGKCLLKMLFGEANDFAEETPNGKVSIDSKEKEKASNHSENVVKAVRELSTVTAAPQLRRNMRF